MIQISKIYDNIKLWFQTQKAKRIATLIMKQKVANIRAGKVIKRKYKKVTQERRKRYGLQTSYVDLTGNRKYSNKSWRLLDSWKVMDIRYTPKAKKAKIIIRFTKELANTIYTAQVKRYGKFLNRA